MNRWRRSPELTVMIRDPEDLREERKPKSIPMTLVLVEVARNINNAAAGSKLLDARLQAFIRINKRCAEFAQRMALGKPADDFSWLSVCK